MRPLFVIILIFAATHAVAEDCGEVVVDCKTHKITIQGESSTIDCGKGTATGDAETATLDGEGQIGGPWVADLESDPIKSGMGVDIEGIPGMGKGGGGKIMHVLPGGGEPSGGDRSQGCIRISNKILDKVKSCQGSKLKIQNAMKNPGTGGMSPKSGGGQGGGQGGQGGEGGDKGKGEQKQSDGKGFQGLLPALDYERRTAPAQGFGKPPATTR